MPSFISRILTSILDTAVVNEEPSGVVAVNQIMLEDMRKTNQTFRERLTSKSYNFQPAYLRLVKAIGL
jgi:hypothetical protein